MPKNIYYTLPNFYEHLQINCYLAEMIRAHPEWLREKNIKAIYASGGYPFCISNGNQPYRGFSCFSNYYEIDSFITKYLSTGIDFKLDFSNMFLTPEDIKNNVYLNLLLEKHNSGSAIIEISNPNLINNFLEKWPSYKISIGPTNDLKEENLEILQTLLNSDNIFSLSLNPQLTYNYDFLKKINHKGKIEILVNSFCPYDCQQKFACNILDNKYQMSFSKKSQYLSCDQCRKEKIISSQMITPEEIKKYVDMGFNHFRFSHQFVAFSLEETFDFYIRYFIKDEYLDLAKGEFFNGKI